MRLARLFVDKPHNAVLSVRRRWPIIERGKVDSTFYKSSAMIYYDRVAKQFKVLEDSGTFSVLEPRFLQDAGWKISRFGSIEISEEKKARDIKRALLARTFAPQENLLEVRNGVLKCVAEEEDALKRKIIHLRV